ncbi:MAG: hypothetical protein E7394_06685 [Ruminococcaceae bacterium]|nr:hypothetical protein [Oscillospiraceae bacterium]
MSNAFVCIMGISTVFVGLICIILLCSLMSFICKLIPEKKAESVPAPKAASGNESISGELAAAVCTAIAEDLGKDVKNIRIVSFKKA